MKSYTLSLELFLLLKKDPVFLIRRFSIILLNPGVGFIRSGKQCLEKLRPVSCFFADVFILPPHQLEISQLYRRAKKKCLPFESVLQ